VHQVHTEKSPEPEAAAEEIQKPAEDNQRHAPDAQQNTANPKPSEVETGQ